MSKNAKNAMPAKTPPVSETISPPEQVLAAAEAAQREAERLAAEEAARAEDQRRADAEAVRAQAEQAAAALSARIAAESAARLEAERRAADEAAQAEAERAAAESSPLVRVRVLVDCALGKPDDVIEIDAAVAATMPGEVDADPAAVAYAESLKKV